MANGVHPAVHETLKLGGPLGKAGLAKLWVAEGGNPSKANLAASIALAESSGQQHSTDNDSNGTVDRGYWQINSVHGAQSTYDPVGNVKAAIAISRNGADFSPWVTYNSGAYKQYLGQPIGNLGSPQVSLPGRSSGNGTTTTTTSGGQPDVQSAGIAALMSAADKPINTSGKVSASDPLSAFATNIASGNYTTPTSTKTIKLPKGSSPAAIGGLGAGSDINPIHGATIGRTDMGVDANLPVGHPIVAMNDSKVVKVVGGWFQGQPLVELRLLAGPNKGKVWYVAEQINSIPHAGQIIRRGGTVARYAPSGTGIEIGWGSPSGDGDTLAQATTGYTEGEQTQAGKSFRNYLRSLGI